MQERLQASPSLAEWRSATLAFSQLDSSGSKMQGVQCILQLFHYAACQRRASAGLHLPKRIGCSKRQADARRVPKGQELEGALQLAESQTAGGRAPYSNLIFSIQKSPLLPAGRIIPECRWTGGDLNPRPPACKAGILPVYTTSPQAGSANQ